MKRTVSFLSEEGSTMMEVERLKRDGSKFVMEGQALGAWRFNVYLTVDQIPTLIKLLLNRSVIFYILSLPILYLRERKGGR